MRDHPIIRDLENNGLPYAKEYVCPVCGEICETIYKDQWGNVCGCENCVQEYAAAEVLDDE